MTKTVIHLAVGIQQEVMQMELSNILQQKVLIKKCSTYYYWTSLTYISYFSNQQNYRWITIKVQMHIVKQYRKVMKKGLTKYLGING